MVRSQNTEYRSLLPLPAFSECFVKTAQQHLSLGSSNIPGRQPAPNLIQLGIESMDQVSMAGELHEGHVDNVAQWRCLVQTTEQITQPQTLTTYNYNHNKLLYSTYLTQ